MARILPISVAVALACELAVSAQQRSSPVPIPRPAPVASVQTGPASGSQFRSTLVFQSRSVLSTPFHAVGRRVLFPGLPFIWGFGVPALYLETPLPLQPLPRDAPKGGVQLSVMPWRASVYVDGMLAGHVEEFKGYYQHLALAAGPHEIAIIDEGYQPLFFVVTVVPGRTLTYTATLSDALAP